MQEALDAWEFDARMRLCLHPRTIQQVRTLVAGLACLSGKSDLAAITTDDALAWLAGQPSARTALHRRSTAGLVFRYLMMRGLIERNPLAAVTLPRVPPGRGADPISIEEAQRVIELARADNRDRRSSGPERARLYWFLWGTALRIGEARVQRWDDLDLRQGVLRVTRAKNRQENNLLLPDWFLQELATWQRVGALMFPRIPCHSMLRRDYVRAGVEGKGLWHRWRKGAITHMARTGVSVPVLARFSRHRNISVLVNNYVTVESAELRRAQGLMAIPA